MRRAIAVVASAVMLGSGCRAEAGCRLRIVTYNVAKLNSENPDNRNCVPGSLSVVIAALNDDDKPGFGDAAARVRMSTSRGTLLHPKTRHLDPFRAAPLACYAGGLGPTSRGRVAR